MKTHTGGCHCGKVRYEVEAEFDGVMDCNCSHCSRKGFLLKFVPASSFKQLHDDAETTEYRFNKGHIQHLFCKTCGVQSYGKGKNQAGEEMIALNARCIDDLDLEQVPVKKVDGKSY